MPDYDTTSLAAGTAAHLEAYDKLLQNAKVSDAFVKANPEMLKDMGFQTPQQYHALSALDKIAATTGYLKAQGAKEYQARMSEMQAQNEARQNAVRADEDAGVFLQRYGKLAAAGTDPRKAFYQTLEEMPTGFNAGRAMPRIMDSLQRWQEATATAKQYGPVEFTDVPGRPGAKVVTRDGYTSVIQPPVEANRTERDPFMEMDYKELVQQEGELAKELTKARAAGKTDTALQLAGQLNSLRKRKLALRNPADGAGMPTPSEPKAKASPYPDGTRLKGPGGKMYVVKNGQPVPE